MYKHFKHCKAMITLQHAPYTVYMSNVQIDFINQCIKNQS